MTYFKEFQFQPTFIDKSISASNFESVVDKSLWKYKSEIGKLKRGFKGLKSDVKATIFNLPLRLYAYILESVRKYLFSFDYPFTYTHC